MGEEAGEGLVCIVFTDLVGWTELGDRIGDEAADVLRRDHFAGVRAALAAYRGHEVKTVGDSVMATFRSAIDALRCAADIQQTALEGEVRVRIGVHAGEPISEDGDVFGTPVNVASRLCAAAGPGEVLLSGLTRSLVGSRGTFEFDDAGDLRLKGLREPVHGFRLRLPAGQFESARGAPVAPPVVDTAVGGAPSDASLPPAVRAREVVAAVPALLCPELVGREAELGRLSARLDQARLGRGGVVGLVGEAGVGKTRLAREVVGLARGAKMTVLEGRAVPGESPVPYRPLTEAFLGAFRAVGRPEAPELAGFEGHLGRLVPAWRTGSDSGADESPLLLGEAVVRLLQVIGKGGEGHGSLLFLDDLQWADGETLAVLDYLLEALRESLALCLFTARPTGSATDLLARIQRRDPASVIGVPLLDEAGVNRVVSGCLSTDAAPPMVRTFVESHSEGNPFLIEELLAGLVASGALMFDDGQWTTVDELTPSVPFSLGESIRHRLAALDGTARRVLGAAAVLGRHFDWELLPGIAEVDGRAVIDGLRQAVDEQLVEVAGSGFRFRHALTREAVLSELLPPERQDLSRRAWPAVERAHPGLPGGWCELAAELAEASGERVSAATRLVESATRALAAGALASAEATAARARRLAGADAEVVTDAEEVLVQALALAGKPDEAAAVGRPLLERLAGGAADRQANLLIVLARAALTGGAADAAAGHAERARDLISRGGLDEVVAARVEAVAAHVALEQGRLDEAEALARSGAARAEATGQPAVECEALEVLGRLARRGEDSAAWFERSAALAERHGLTGWQLRARHELALDEWTHGRVQPLRDARDFAARNGALVTVAVMDLSLADAALGAFDRAGCLDSAQRCVDLSRRYGLATLPVAQLWLAGAHALAGDDQAMESAAAEALRPDPDDPRILGDLWGRVRATRSILRDDRAQLHADLESMMGFVRVAPPTTSLYPNRLLWALLHTIEDDDLGAAARAEIGSATNLMGKPYFQLTLEISEAVALGRAGRNAEATTSFIAASGTLLSSYEFTGTTQYLRLRAAEAALRDGWGEPIAWFREAEAFFAAGGYDSLARLCRTRLGEAGAPVPRPGRGASTVPPRLRALGVTSRELDVLNLLAERLSNREIADRLFLSPKTVERHVASLFDRTGIRDRVALGEFARSQTG